MCVCGSQAFLYVHRYQIYKKENWHIIGRRVRYIRTDQTRNDV